jgi:UDP-N-acetylmuramoylalanine--D-glutamate ligase
MEKVFGERRMELKAKKVTVIGMGNSGVNAAILLDDIGADVGITDSGDNPDIRRAAAAFEHRAVRIEIGRHTKDFLSGSELVVVSPGVEASSAAVKWAEELGIPVIGEMELGCRFCKGEIIAVTGTNGKSTVTTLIGEMLKDAGLDTVVCGNIGNSLCGEIRRITAQTHVVLETSSFQLERIDKFRPRIAVMLNITDDHLDRYKTFQEYYDAKLRVFSNQTADDILVLNADAPNLKPIEKMARSKILYYSRSKRANGAYVEKGDIICFAGDGARKTICAAGEMRLKGSHNLENTLASSLVAVLHGADASSIRHTIAGFKGLPHRIETVAVIDGVEYVDDSKGTTVDSTYRALESFDNALILIAGGRDKMSDYTAIKGPIKAKVQHLILIGEAKERIYKALKGATDIREVETLEEAVRTARGLARKGTTVLLSPMCSSFDMFRDYKERGEVFRNAVMSLSGAKEKVYF